MVQVRATTARALARHDLGNVAVGLGKPPFSPCTYYGSFRYCLVSTVFWKIQDTVLLRENFYATRIFPRHRSRGTQIYKVADVAFHLSISTKFN